MSDLLKEARQYRTDGAYRIVHKLADEIERLTANLEHYEDALCDLVQLEADNERLREIKHLTTKAFVKADREREQLQADNERLRKVLADFPVWPSTEVTSDELLIWIDKVHDWKKGVIAALKETSGVAEAPIGGTTAKDISGNGPDEGGDPFYVKLAQRIVAQEVGGRNSLDGSLWMPPDWTHGRPYTAEQFCQDGRVVLALMEKCKPMDMVIDTFLDRAKVVVVPLPIFEGSVSESLAIAIVEACLEALEI